MLKSAKQCEKRAETILPFSCCPLVFFEELRAKTILLGVFSWCLHVASYSCIFVVIVPLNVNIGGLLCGNSTL